MWSTVLNNLGLVVGATGALFSLWALVRQTRSVQRPVQLQFNEAVVSSRLTSTPTLAVTYAGVPVQRLTRTRVALWNEGLLPISGHDVASVDPLVLRVNEADASILACEIVDQPQPANSFSVLNNCDAGGVAISFDYFAHHEGVVIDVYHTGQPSSGLELKGTLKGVRSIEVYQAPQLLLDRLWPRIDRWLSKRQLPFVLHAGAMLLIGFPLGVPLLAIDFIYGPVSMVLSRTPPVVFTELIGPRSGGALRTQPLATARRSGEAQR